MKHWETLTQWVDYLLANGVDTGDQFSSDNFAGECQHNANLSIKLILGIASYAQLADMLNKKEEARKYMETAKEFANEWEAKANSGNHYYLAFDQPETWSQKYNLVWDRLLNLNVFPTKVMQKEIAFYADRMDTYGCPLDSRNHYSKTDWAVWAASLSNDREAFRKLVEPIHRFMNETTDRIPMADLINTDQATVAGFSGRPVVGGYFIHIFKEKINK